MLFLLKRGRIRVFRVSPEGRALTSAIVLPGTMFGEMALLGQRMYDNYAEALDEAYTCVMDHGRISSSDLGGRPVLLAVGSRTCPVTESAGPVLRRLHAEFGDKVRFVVVNTREALASPPRVSPGRVDDIARLY